MNAAAAGVDVGARRGKLCEWEAAAKTTGEPEGKVGMAAPS